MSLTLLRSAGPTDLEGHLTWKGLVEAGCDGVFYGGGVFSPGCGYDALANAVAHKEVRAVIGVTVDDRAFALSPELRDHLGYLVRVCPWRLVTDQISVHWFLHYGVEAEVGGHPAWLCPPSSAEYVFDRAHEHDGTRLIRGCDILYDAAGQMTIVAIDSVAVATAAAICGLPMVLVAEHHWGVGTTATVANTPLIRWAKNHDMMDAVCYDDRNIDGALARHMPAEAVRVAKERAMETLRRINVLQSAPSRSDDVLASAGLIPAAPQQTDWGKARELTLGTPFDPATHYTAEYFGEGAGLVYTKPDGTKNLYHGPAREWAGFQSIVRLMERVLPIKGDLLDIGCGPGCFVRHAIDAGFNAYGVDISEAAIAAAHEEVQPRLLCADVTQPWRQPGAPASYTVLTALDFWEHIFEPDLDELIDGVHGLLAPAGFGFFCICTRGTAERDWTISRGDVFTAENSWLLASGHVTIRRWAWWAKRFANRGFRVRTDLSGLFQVLRDEDPGLRSVESWGPKNVLVVEKA